MKAKRKVIRSYKKRIYIYIYKIWFRPDMRHRKYIATPSEMEYRFYDHSEFIIGDDLISDFITDPHGGHTCGCVYIEDFLNIFNIKEGTKLHGGDFK